ncbi:MAG: Rne/Rng family ribonuclease [Pyrinomonadaceae bacterium]
MAKELIVSVNGREKKIAIVENERVTEFYIERGEDNQGIVGNIYKGRVMRVLPGMQSAFVDIGLERDAFLYVSDFFDEEEEFERIVVDKTKAGGADRAEAERVATERIEQQRIEREQRIEATQERVEPFAELSQPAVPIVEGETVAVEDEAAPVALQGEETAQEETEEAEQGGKRRGRRGRKRGKGQEQASKEARPEQAAGIASTAPESFDIQTPFVAADTSFERVVDEDETIAAENGAMFKDARLQERIFDQIHAVEFDMEDVPEAEVGSILPQTSSRNSFQRIDDSDIAPASEATAPVRETVAAHVDAFVDEVNEGTLGARSFERVSDDEVPSEAQASAGTGKAATTARGKSKGTRSATKKGKGAEAVSTAAAGEAAKPKRASKKAEGAKKGASKKAASGSKASSAKGRKSKSAANDEGANSNAVSESLQDSEASVTSGRGRAEFATRRGGRRRRRPGKPQEANGGDERVNGKDHDAKPATEIEEVVVEERIAAPPPPPPPRARAERERPAREERSSNGRDNRDNRGGRGGGGGGSRDRDGRDNRRERQHPTITDLLREGQEVLVQIAKEPIAKKGARITSHIALPGRFLVYMPTVEHVGVSRKIESDSERARLRKLIQTIRATEDVPSGGFIVRTAGTGISEDDLREDARYLVRTWLDIRRSAEKVKAPSIAHRDLDLVQRLLRDQLSDDFTAIRVDSEDEYQRIVEFINRIQPRMVKRVKLYTRETPILEAYEVQAEIDKAIKPRVWLKSGGYLVINQTEALVAIDVNTGKFVGRGGNRLEDTITKTNLEAVDEIVRQIRLRDLGGIIVLDLIDMEDRRNRNRVMQALQEALQGDKSPTKVLSFNDFGLVIMTRKRVKQSLERTLCAPCPYCTGAGLVKSPQTICYEILEEARSLSRGMDDGIKQTTLRVHPEVARALRGSERDVWTEIEDYLGAVDITSDSHIHQEQFDFAFI